MKFSKQQTRYVSEFDQFIEHLKQERPYIEEEQRLGRAIHWDHLPLTLEDQMRERESRIRQQPYVYQNKV
ncbi:MAG: DUF3460 family protein [Burkholderiaceae bacterium]